MHSARILACLGIFLAAWPISADPLAGQNDPRFQAALALWLSDDEPTALPELSALAAEGNRAAQLLVARIDVTPQLQGPWLATRPKAERNALMRAPGGLSGRSWMIAAAEDEPVAQLWRERDDPAAADAETAMAFAALGEMRASRDVLQTLAVRQYRDFAAVADDPRYPPELRFLIWREWAADPTGRAKVDAEIAALPPGDPQIQRFDSRPVPQADVDSWLATAPLAAPLRSFCTAACPNSTASCPRAILRVVDDPMGLAVRGTPSETLIPSDVWNASPRGRASLLREPEARSMFSADYIREVTGLDVCVGAALAAEAARFPE